MTTPTPQFWFDLPNAPSTHTELAFINDIPDGGVKMVSLELKPDAISQVPFKCVLLRSGDNVAAYVNRCAHFGMPLSAKPEHLKFDSHVSISCNVHYARFRWHDGYCEHGDCVGESLIAIPITIEADGRIVISG